MIHEYIITAFKVIVGVITENRLVLSALIALGILFVWMILSLVFSFQGKFASNVKRMNEFISRNGIKGEAKQNFELLVAKMPSEFQKGYKKYDSNKNALPSDFIKRFDCLDMELSGGVFNQNKSVIKTFINFIFVGLALFSLAVLPIDEPLSGYNLCEALVIPLVFFLIAKIMYYAYTAIRQYQYKSAIEEFNFMMENMDRASFDFVDNSFVNKQEEIKSFNYINQNVQARNVEEIKEDFEVQDIQESSNNVYETVPNVQSETKDVYDVEELEEEENIEDVETAPQEKQINELEEIKEETNELTQQDIVVKENVPVEHVDNFKPDFESLLEGEEVVEQKRGRGRPRKEVVNNGELVITSDKEFEEALLRAEKLMRKNEEPLSASQTKRIEKQIKELVDAMTKYKEGK